MNRFVHFGTVQGKYLLRNEAGTELFEAAVTLPIVLTLLLGIFSMGRAYSIYQTITYAAREGARYGLSSTCATCGNTQSACGGGDDDSGIGKNSFPDDTAVTCVINNALQAAALDPNNVNPQISIQRQQVLNPTDPLANQVQGIVITFGYPYKFVIPFTNINATTITITTNVQMKQEF